MKYQYLKLLFIELFLIAFSFFHFFFIKQINQVYYAIELILLSLIIYSTNKIDKKENYRKNEITSLIVISILIYYIVTYFSGFFLGFVYTTYSRSLGGIIRNVITSSLVILTIEYIRDIILQKGRYYRSIILLSIIVSTLLELLFLVNILGFQSRISSLEITLVIILPCLFRNIFLTYCTYYFGKINSIIYHLAMVVISYIVPIFPDLGDYVSSIIIIIHPFILMVSTALSFFYHSEKIKDTYKYKRYEKVGKYVYYFIIFILLIMVYLVSDLGRFTILAIGSESMHGSIDKGDIVLIDKKKTNYKVGDVLAFNYNGTVIVHRVVEVNKDNTYITKGDANNGKDNWIVNNKMIKGSVNFYVKYVGWPTVKLSEYLEEGN